MKLRPISAGMTLGLIVIIGAVIALFLAFRYAQSEADRDSMVWQGQMAVVINSREVAVEDWLDEQKKVITRLVENPSLRIYLGNIEVPATAQSQESQENLAQSAYLENLMKAAAQQNGYMSEVSDNYKVNANLPQPHLSGLALTNPRGEIIVSTPDMPPVVRSVADYMEHSSKDTIIYGPYPAENGAPAIAFTAPIVGVQDEIGSSPIGFAVGIKILSNDFFQKLEQPGDTSETAKNYLVRKKGGAMEYLSPVRTRNGDINQPLTMVMDAGNPDLAATFAVETATEVSGGFAERINYDGERVLVTGRKIKDTDWVLVRTINSSEVMGAIQTRKRTIVWIAGLTILAVSILILLIWRHGVSVRVARAARKQKILTKRYEKLSHFLQVVTDSQPTVITAVDTEGRYTFANAQASKDTGLSSKEMIGLKLKAIPSSLVSEKNESYCHQVLKTGEPVSIIERLTDSNITIKSDFIPLSVDKENGVLMVTEDISPLVRERERRETALKNLVSTLTMVIDSRDPYSARHSERVATVAKAIATEMKVDEITQETANISGALMNLGKILVPRELLTKPKGLTEAELETIRSGIMKSADMLETVDFDGPVVKTLRQIRAHWDGSGSPEGLAGEEILLSARIVSVANAFVGMCSARAHRPGMDMEKAVSLLMNETDRIYDRKPVVALMNFLSNKGGLEQWGAFGVPLTEASDEQS